MWTYRARVIDVVDSCTIDVEADLGFDIQASARVTLKGTHLPIGPEATAQVEAWIRARADDSTWPFILTLERTVWLEQQEVNMCYTGTVTTRGGDSLNEYMIRWACDIPF